MNRHSPCPACLCRFSMYRNNVYIYCSDGSSCDASQLRVCEAGLLKAGLAAETFVQRAIQPRPVTRLTREKTFPAARAEQSVSDHPCDPSVNLPQNVPVSRIASESLGERMRRIKRIGDIQLGR